MAERKPGTPPADAVKDRAAQKHDLAYEETGGETAPGFYPAEAIGEREGDITPDAADPHVVWDNRIQPERADETRPRARNDDGEAVESKGKPTARDAYGHKEKGYAEHGEPDADEDSVPLGK